MPLHPDALHPERQCCITQRLVLPTTSWFHCFFARPQELEEADAEAEAQAAPLTALEEDLIAHVEAMGEEVLIESEMANAEDADFLAAAQQGARLQAFRAHGGVYDSVLEELAAKVRRGAWLQCCYLYSCAFPCFADGLYPRWRPLACGLACAEQCRCKAIDSTCWLLTLQPMLRSPHPAGGRLRRRRRRRRGHGGPPVVEDRPRGPPGRPHRGGGHHRRRAGANATPNAVCMFEAVHPCCFLKVSSVCNICRPARRCWLMGRCQGVQ